MQKFKFAFFAQFIFLVLLSFSNAAAQQAPPQQDENPPQPAAEDDRRGEPLFRQLNLSFDQIRQIREINRSTRETMRDAVQKQREARRALDLAIYSEAANEQEVEQRARQFAEAQGELAKLRARTEFRIRQVLNKEQLARFIEVRRDAAENARTLRQKGFPPQKRPLRQPVENKPGF